MEIFSRVTIGCFLTSYLVALGLELTRPLLRFPGRWATMLFFACAGLVTQVLYLVIAVRKDVTAQVGLWASWHEWALLVAFVVAATYAITLWRKPEATVGYFLLPLVLMLIAAAWWVRDQKPFSATEAVGFWLTVHGLAMLAGTVAALLGLAVSVMYLVHAARLKKKQLGGPGLRLPPLDRLQQAGRACLYSGVAALAIGLVAGVIANLNRSERVGWTESGVLLSGVLFVWLCGASLFEGISKPARRGAKVAYVSVAQAVFLVIALAGVLASPHGRQAAEPRELPAGGSNGAAGDADTSAEVHP